MLRHVYAVITAGMPDATREEFDEALWRDEAKEAAIRAALGIG